MLHPRWYYLRRVKTDRDGRFQIDAVWLGECSLLVDSPTYVIHETGMIPVEKPASITLRPGARVAGQLIYANTKAPVPGVRLLIDRDRETVTDAEGRFFFQGVKPGQNAVRVEHETLFSLQPGFIIPEGGDVFGVALEVVQGGIIEGRVYDAQTGEGILMADVRIERESSTDSTFPRPEMTTANNEGEFKFTKLLPGTYRVEWVDATEYVRSVNPELESLEVDYWKTISGVDLGLMKGATIRGTIVAPPEVLAQRPMVSFRYVDEAVQTRQDEHRSSGAQSDGRFRLAGLLLGEPVILRAGGGKWKSAEAGPFTPGIDGIEGVTLTLLENPLGSVSGRLVYGNGLAVAEGDIELQQVDGSHFARAEIDENGEFLAQYLPAGTYELRARAYRMRLPEPMQIAVADGQALTGVVVDFGGGGEIIAGHVVDNTGTPIPGAEVRIRGPEFGGAPQTSGELGEFAVVGLAPASYDVTVRADGYSIGMLKGVPASTKNLRVVLDRQGAIKGRAINGQTGQPVDEFEVAVAPAKMVALDTGRSLPYRRFIHEEGAFRVDNLSPGAWVVIARARGMFPDSVEVELSAGQTATVADLMLHPGAVANVIIVNAQGQPLQGAEVYPNGWPDLSVQLRPDKGSIKTNAEGLATLENLVPGTNLLYVTHADYVPSQFELDVQAGATLSPTFTLHEGGVLEGIVAAEGRPIADAYVRLSYADADLTGFEHFHTEAQTDAQGAYRITGLVTGTAVVDVHGQNQKLRRNIAVSRGQTSRADFNFETGTAAVTGTVRFSATEPEFEQTMLMLDVATPTGLVQYVAPLDPDGSFALDNVRTGEAELMAVGMNADGSRRMKVAVLTISPGSRITQDIDFGQGATVQGIVDIRLDHPEIYAVLVAGDVDASNLNNAAYASILHQRTIGQIELDASSRFQFDAVDPGEYTLIVVTADLGEKTGTPVTVREGDEVVNVNVVFP
ncbi:MAG: carboxypeptidase regulatory-like domain-containing protein [Candidatus Hydrogenedentes bacterium]|nr:carboxypeptidase regulatory-like domain-containing protein [Candidatus Hydrogenedentota bacterium]